MITFIIGNGFDVQVGLKTRYTDFYKIYTKIKDGDSEVIRRFKKEILKSEADGWKNWADFELGLGEHSINFSGKTPAKEFMECFDDFAKCFNEYLKNECAKVDWNSVDSAIHNPFIASIAQFYNYIKRTSQNEIKKLIEYGATVNFLQFNYTDVFNKLASLSKLESRLRALPPANHRITYTGKNLQVHGALDKYHTMGVDNELQIKNEVIRNDFSARQIFIKPQYLDMLDGRDANITSAREEAVKILSESGIICVFGASVGHTDKYWWEKIGERLKDSDCIIVIFDICGAKDDGVSPLSVLESETKLSDRKTKIANQFLELSGLEAEWFQENQNKVIVELDTEMFDFKIPMITETTVNQKTAKSA